MNNDALTTRISDEELEHIKALTDQVMEQIRADVFVALPISVHRHYATVLMAKFIRLATEDLVSSDESIDLANDFLTDLANMKETLGLCKALTPEDA